MYDNVAFTLGYEALTLLGKGMYSNLWAALSELIANGIDAHAENVYVYIDMSDRAHSMIEILDDGDGMSYEDIKTKYAVIGNNKRDDAPDAEKLMGRKGVGKLAALFLTTKFEFLTAKEGEESSVWQFDFSNRANKHPMLVNVTDDNFEMLFIFNKKNKGTLLKLFDVNLSNMAEEAVNALSLIMSNYFLYQNLPKVNVKFYTKFSRNDAVDFDKPLVMTKKIAFGNMIALLSDDTFKRPEILSPYKMALQYGESFDSEFLLRYRKDESFSKISKTEDYYTVEINNKEEKIPYALRGWIGIHASIDQKEAKQNDELFVKNRFYNPNKLRLYIRNKLAVEDFLGYIKNTQQGVNYIEGEISFDLLDDDRLDDITTSNRQDVDIHDPRVGLLIDIVKKLVTKLIGYRVHVTDEVSAENKRRKNIIETRAKKYARKAIQKDLSSLGLKETQTMDILNAVSNKFKGNEELAAKEIFKIFISHSKKDRRFSDFIYNLLKVKGAKEEDIFYTTYEVGGNSNLAENIKKNISEVNVMVLFLDSVNSIRSQYCMFEGGAFWATRSINDCVHIHFDTSWIPDYINDTKKYHVPFNEGRNITEKAFLLTEKKYNETIDVLNLLIDHLNSSVLHVSSKITKFQHVNFPPEIELRRRNERDGTNLSMTDFMDKDFVDCWKMYVVDGITDLRDDGSSRTKQDFIDDYNSLVTKM